MHETAEIFWREANLTFDPMSAPAINVPDGFLHEWWLTIHDMYRALETKNPDSNEGSSYVQQIINGSLQGNPSPSREQEMNEQMIRELTDSSDFGLTTGGNLMPSMRCHLVKTEQISQGLTSTQPLQKSLTFSKRLDNPDNLGDIVAKGVDPSICATPNEIGRKRKNSACSEDGSNAVPGATDCPSETSSSICKSFNDIVKLSSLNVDDNKDKGKTSPSNSQRNHTTAEINTLKGYDFHD